jgi:hypothetical protein
MKLLFKVDKSILACKTIEQYKNPNNSENIVNFLNLAWELNKDFCTILDKRLSLFDYCYFNNLEAGHEANRLQKYIKALTQTNEFEILYKETKESKKEIIKEWSITNLLIKAYLKEFNITLNDEFKVYLVHPNQNAGRYLGNNKILWSYKSPQKQLFKYYNSVYLAHEMLHSYFGTTDREHAIIELLTDNELRTRLDPSQKYPPFEGHEYLNKLKAELLPIWKNFLKQDKKDINDFVAKLP